MKYVKYKKCKRLWRKNGNGKRRLMNKRATASVYVGEY